MRLKTSGKLAIFAALALAILTTARQLRIRHLLPSEFCDWAGRFRHILSIELFQVGGSPVRIFFLIKVAVFFFLLNGFTRFARYALRRLLQPDPRFDDHSIYVISRLLTAAIFIVGCLLGVQVEHINLHTFVLIGGTIGIAVGLGVQRYVSNLVSGFALLAEGQLRLGDFVQVGEHQGFVERLGATSSQIRTPNNTTLLIPNAEIANKELLNYSGRHTTFRLVLPLSVAYGTDAEYAIAEITKVAVAHPSVLDRPSPSIVLTGLESETMKFQVRVWTKTHPEDFDTLGSDLYLAITRMFKANGISLPRPAWNVWVNRGRTEVLHSK